MNPASAAAGVIGLACFAAAFLLLRKAFQQAVQPFDQPARPEPFADAYISTAAQYYGVSNQQMRDFLEGDPA